MLPHPSSFRPGRPEQSGAGGEPTLAPDAGNRKNREEKALAQGQGHWLGSHFSISLAAATIVLLASAWLSSGTMAPYAATLAPKVVRIQPPCEYLTNIDHLQFQATFWMLQGKPRSAWEGSVVLRRILYPILAYPLMTVLGFENGGFVTNLILTLAAFLAFVLFVRRAIGEQAAIVAMWLLATYPGIAYWVGLPYSYVWIVPGSLLLTMLLWKLARATGYISTSLVSLAIGFLFWGYDLFPFFGTAALLVLARRRHFTEMLIALVGMALPVGILLLSLEFVFHVPLRNSNTETYWVVLRSFTEQIDYPGWWGLLSALPSIFVDNFLFSNFLFLPLLFVLLALMSLISTRSLLIETPELEILLAALLVFLLNNLAPPYGGWQLRGVWIARLYQPVFVAFVLFASRSVQRWWHARRESGALLGRISALLVALTVIPNASVVFGPFLRLPMASTIYQRFYRHSPPDSLSVNIDLNGRRPLGICKSSPNSG